MVVQQNNCYEVAEFEGHSDLAQLAQALSPELAKLVHSQFSGIELRVPKKINAKHFISQKIGYENAVALSEYIAGGVLEVPMQLPNFRIERQKLVQRLASEGRPHREIALQTKMTQRHIRRILSNISRGKQF